MTDDGGGPVFPATPPERIELPGERALVRVSADRATATAAAINESLEHLAPWMTWAVEPATEAGMAAFLATGSELWDARRDFSFSVVEGDEERVVGACGLHGRHDEHALEIGYWVHVDRTGRGIATDLTGALTTAAFGIAGIERVVIQCDERNVRSARVPEKLGYRLVDVSVPDAGPCQGRSTQLWIVERADWVAGTNGAAP